MIIRGAGLRISPVTCAEAKAFVGAHHRHNKPPIAHIFSLGLRDDEDRLVGVAMAGLPKARQLMDGETVEVMRVCVLEGHKNACSMLYGAAKRAAKALGYRRVVTYTLASEPGTTPRAAGFREAGRTAGRRWATTTRRVGSPSLFDLEMPDQGRDKVRWEVLL